MSYNEADREVLELELRRARRRISELERLLGSGATTSRVPPDVAFQESLFKTVFDNYPGILYAADPETYEVLFVNDNLGRLLDADPVGRRCYEVFQGLGSPCPFCTNHILLEGRSPYVWEHTNELLGRDFLVTDQLITWPDGRLVRFEVAIDVTEHNRAQAALAEQERFMSKVLDLAPTAVYIYDIESQRNVFVNEGIQRLLGYSPSRVLKLGDELFSEILHPEDFPTVLAHQKHMRCASDDAVLEVEYRMQHRNGHWIRLRSFERVFARNANGRVTQTAGVAIDVTALREAEWELHRSRSDLERFMYVASHDLQEPMRGIRLSVERLEERLGDSVATQCSELFDALLADTDRMNAVIDDLLEYTEISVRPRFKTPVLMTNAVQAALRGLRAEVEATGAVVAVGAMPLVLADEYRMEQLLGYLLENALRFSKAGAPSIEISCSQQGSSWLFSVRDNGRGLPEKDFERVFSLFVRGSNAEDTPGTGIGLAIAKNIVEQHGGAIWLESRLDHGSTVWFTLPCAYATE